MKDLLALVADSCMEHVLTGLLGRPQSLGIRPITYDVRVHPRRDPGCFNDAHHFLRPFLREYAYALVMFDHEGCGREQQPADSVANEVKQRLEQNGWSGRAEVVVLSPELEVWVWSNSPHVPVCLGWTDRHPSLRQWLMANGHWPSDAHKPPRPKEAMMAALRHVRKPYSAAIYSELATRVHLHGHSEPAFLRFTGALREWFGS